MFKGKREEKSGDEFSFRIKIQIQIKTQAQVQNSNISMNPNGLCRGAGQLRLQLHM